LVLVVLQHPALVTQDQLLHFHHSHQPAVVEVVHSIHNSAATAAQVVAVQGVTHLKLTQAELESQDKVMLVELIIIQPVRFHQVVVVDKAQ
jgi:hypothetical protein